jgi:hypothetical protein
VKIIQIETTVLRVISASLTVAITAGTPLILAGDKNAWMAMLGAVVPGLLNAARHAFSVYASKGTITDADAEEIVQEASK